MAFGLKLADDNIRVANQIHFHKPELVRFWMEVRSEWNTAKSTKEAKNNNILAF